MLIKVVVINEIFDRRFEMILKVVWRVCGLFLLVIRKYRWDVMYKGCVIIFIKKLVNERVNNKVFEGECSVLVC